MVLPLFMIFFSLFVLYINCCMQCTCLSHKYSRFYGSLECLQKQWIYKWTLIIFMSYKNAYKSSYKEETVSLFVFNTNCVNEGADLMYIQIHIPYILQLVWCNLPWKATEKESVKQRRNFSLLNSVVLCILFGCEGDVKPYTPQESKHFLLIWLIHWFGTLEAWLFFLFLFIQQFFCDFFSAIIYGKCLKWIWFMIFAIVQTDSSFILPWKNIVISSFCSRKLYKSYGNLCGT